MDVAGEQQLDVEHNLFKRRLDKDLKAVSMEAEKHGEPVFDRLPSAAPPTPRQWMWNVYIWFWFLVGLRTFLDTEPA